MDIETLMQQGVTAYGRHDYTQALACFTHVLDIDPAHLQGLNNRGALLLQQGLYEQAQDCFARALAIAPEQVEALSNSSFALNQLGRGEEALVQAQCALALAPRHIGALNNRGVALQAMGRLEEAVACFAQALGLQPHFPQALNNLGLSLHRLGRYEDALACLRQALQLQPKHTEALNNYGLVLDQLHRHEEALTSFDRVLHLYPGHLEALNNRGLVLIKLKRLEEALVCFERALAQQPHSAGTLNNLGLCLHGLERNTDAVARFDRALALDADHCESHNNRGLALQSLERHAEALASFDRALDLQPRHAGALRNRASALFSLGRHAEALAGLEQALQIAANDAATLNTLGALLEKLNRREEALTSFNRALQLEPEFTDAQCNRGMVRMALGDLPGGFRDNECRLDAARRRDPALRGAAPYWQGQTPLQGKTIIVHHEQGFGDTLQFVRYAPLLAEAGAQVVLRVPPALQSLLRSLPGGMRIISLRDVQPPHDLQCMMMSLPPAFGTTLDTIPAQVPYLHADAAKLPLWNARLGNSNKPRIGLAWAGRQYGKVNHTRDMGLHLLLPLLRLDAHFVSLQKDIPQSDREQLSQLPGLARLGESAADFADTAALIANLDLVITVDTAVAHLAGALGKPVWIMHRHAACWRWLQHRLDSPWYPTARLFRQRAFGDWDSLAAEVAVAARAWLAAGNRGTAAHQPMQEGAVSVPA
ncbi:MAG: tetratricopeptide repeat protein [Nevskia sp.]|nr:tetratricopeptide repeat protein [Nevskia sp.]